ncbi:MAG: hypothetical protein NTW49_03040 [Bacteroidia bacterium]|nr:hypothetical protein [Bacteroidia bacterium]
MKQLKITDCFESTDANYDFKASLTNIFDHFNYPIALFVATYQDITSNFLFYKVKTCEDFNPTKEFSSALLQVFRL